MNQASDWYRQLKKPTWPPPESLFGQVWSVLYVIIFVVNGAVISMLARGTISWMVALPFWLNLFFNSIFTPIQFGLRNNLLAVIDILLVLGTIVWSMIAIWPHSKWIVVAYIPYLIWVSIATVLQISIFWLNR